MPGTRGPVPVPQKESRDLTQTVLDLLSQKDTFKTSEEFPDVSQREIKAALDRLGSRSMIEYDTLDSEKLLLTAEGKTIVDEGSHEYKVWDAVKSKGKVAIKELPVRSFLLNGAFGSLFLIQVTENRRRRRGQSWSRSSF